MRAAAVTFGLGAALILSGCGPGAALDALPGAGRAKVAAAVSGDTLVLGDGHTLRLAEVDAPNSGEPYAEEARAALAKLAEGREVELIAGGALADPNGRPLALVRATKGRVWLQMALLRQGAARVRTYPDNRALAAPLLEAEAQARASKRGLWALPTYRVRLPQELDPRAEDFVVVEARVRRVVRDGTRRLLVLDPRPGGLAAEVPASALDDFAAANVPLGGLAGRLVRVRGRVRPTRDGPRLWLDHPEPLQLLSAR